MVEGGVWGEACRVVMICDLVAAEAAMHPGILKRHLPQFQEYARRSFVTCNEHHDGPRAGAICSPRNCHRRVPFTDLMRRIQSGIDPPLPVFTAISQHRQFKVESLQYAFMITCSNNPSFLSSAPIARLCENGDQSGWWSFTPCHACLHVWTAGSSQTNSSRYLGSMRCCCRADCGAPHLP